jgi:hypothetical protein
VHNLIKKKSYEKEKKKKMEDIPKPSNELINNKNVIYTILSLCYNTCACF